MFLKFIISYNSHWFSVFQHNDVAPFMFKFALQFKSPSYRIFYQSGIRYMIRGRVISSAVLYLIFLDHNRTDGMRHWYNFKFEILSETCADVSVSRS